MVDFRYHLVSLVSVFLALALGIILGAGPLQNSIGNTLQDQVSKLRTSRDGLRTELDQATQKNEATDAALEVAGKQLIPGTLEGRHITFVVLPGVDSTTVDDARARLEQAGGKVASQIQVQEGFVSADNTSYRNALASQMAGHVEGVDEGSDSMVALAKALNIIARKPSNDADVQSLTGYFAVKDKGHELATFSQNNSPGADAVLVFVPSGIVEDAEAQEKSDDAKSTKKLEEKQAEQEATNDMWKTFYKTFASGGPTVAFGQAESASLLTELREMKAGSTVDSPGTVSGSFNTVFALASTISGKNVDLGSGEGASAPFGTRVDAGNHG